MHDDNSYKTLDLSTTDHVATLVLDCPDARNAVSAVMRAELHDAFSRLADDDDVRVILLAGRGPVFCAGADLGETDPPPAERLLVDEYLPIFQCMKSMDKPIISAVSGVAAGIGMSLALACDLTIMADDASFWAPFTRLGLVPDGGLSWMLTRQLGYRGACAVAIEAERIPAERALALGLANRVVPSAELQSHANEWANELAAGSPLALAHVKRLMHLATRSDFETVFAAEARAQQECENSEFYQKARAAFLGK